MAKKNNKKAAEAANVETVEKTARKREININMEDPFMRQQIMLVVEENPKRSGSKAAARFDHYENGITVAEFIKRGGTRGDINWDIQKGHIKFVTKKD